MRRQFKATLRRPFNDQARSDAGFDLRQQWLEPDARFALTLFAAR